MDAVEYDKAAKTHRVVHLSDIHFGQERNGEVIVNSDMRQELVEDCRRQRAALGPADCVLITGDTAFAGKSEDYEKAAEWLDRIAAAIGCGRTAVKVVPGNHDVDIDKIDVSAGLVNDKLREVTIDKSDQLLCELTADEDRNLLLKKFTDYRVFASQYECDFQSSSRPSWIKDVWVSPWHVLRFVGLNTVQVSDKSDCCGNMSLGTKQYIIPREDNVEYVVLMHHPLGWLKDCIKAREYIESRARIIMVGHEHFLNVEKINDARGGERLEIFAGAVTPPRDDTSFGYVYQWIEFKAAAQHGHFALSVAIHPRIWDPVSTQFVSDTARLGGETYRIFSLRCPQYFAPPVPATSHTAPSAARPPAAANGGLMIQDDTRFARLQLFFWRYLDWRQRNSLLSSMGLLPAVTTPVPQTAERQAIDRAKETGRLAELWDAIMKRLPADKREPNPFTTERE